MKKTVISYLFVGLMSSTILFSTKAHASGGWAESLRPYVVQFLGQDIANKLLGEVATAHELPEIPDIEKVSTSTRSFPKEEAKKEFKRSEQAAYDQMYIRELYEVTRQRAANDKDLAQWMNTMSQGATREGIYRALVLDGAYAGLEGMDYPLTDRAVQFGAEFMNKYIGKKLSNKAISQVNLYSMKRIMTEDSLELIDQFLYENRIEDLYTWYAVLSAQLASEHPNAFASKTRADANFETHLVWARAVTWQTLKGEVIYKLHHIMNLLNKA